MNKTINSSAGAQFGAAPWLGVNPCTGNESESFRISESQGTKPNPKAGVDDSPSLPLPQLLGMMQCSGLLPGMARNSLERQHLQALLDLWLSLGRPVSGFWPHIRVFYNRILDSYDLTPNVALTDPAAKPKENL